MGIDLITLQQRNDQTLTDISGLQTIETELFTKLNQGISSQSLTPVQQAALVTQINEISTMRINLYSNLRDSYSFYQQNASSTVDTISEQEAAINIIETELNAAKERLKLIESEKANKLRLVEINTYYGERYNAHSNIMKIIIYICILIFILTILANIELIPNSIYAILMIITLIIGIIYLWKDVIDVFNRDNMNFEEYDWYFNPKDHTTNADGINGTDPWANLSLNGCINGDCCDTNSHYDATVSHCVSGPASLV